MSVRHNPEFTLLELYQAYADYEDIINLTEELIRHVAVAVNGSAVLEYNGVTIDLEKPFTRLSMVDAVKEYAKVDFRAVKDVEEARLLAKEHHIAFEDIMVKVVPNDSSNIM